MRRQAAPALRFTPLFSPAYARYAPLFSLLIFRVITRELHAAPPRHHASPPLFTPSDMPPILMMSYISRVAMPFTPYDIACRHAAPHAMMPRYKEEAMPAFAEDSHAILTPERYARRLLSHHY